MPYHLAYNGLILLHFSFILLVVFGGFLILWKRWFIYIHFPVAVWGFLVETAGWYCPLTRWENRFRQLAGLEGYSGGFIDHYIVNLIYPPGLTRPMQIGMGLAVVGINAVVYWVVFRKGSR